MNLKPTMISFLLASLLTCLLNCKEDEATPDPPDEETDTFYFGADLSYVNQILDHGGVYKDQGAVKSPYKIFHDHGTNLVRLRLWHNPLWTKEVYGDAGTQLYNDLADVEKAIRLAKEQNMEVLLDLHYSDTWADPGNQKIPQAWKEITTLAVLKDSVYNYTHKVLQYLDNKDLMPELVQIGNETNCGMLYTDAPDNFPACNVCDGAWQNMGEVVNRAIAAIKDVAASSEVKTKILLHVADPKNVEWWFDNMKNNGGVTGFDIVGFSYYPLWHTTVSLDQLSDKVATFKSKYDKDVMILETAYPWTTAAEDGYANHFGSETPITGFPYSKQGQLDLLKKITQEVHDGGGIGVIYWEPAWISSNLKDQWGTGSSWENSTFFDFDGNAIQVMDYATADYK